MNLDLAMTKHGSHFTTKSSNIALPYEVSTSCLRLTASDLRLTLCVCLSVLYYDRRSVGQSVLVSSSHLWLMTRFFHCQTIAGFLYGTPSLTIGRVCLLQCTIYNTFYCFRFETTSLYLYPPGTGWPGYTPRHWVDSQTLISIIVWICTVILYNLCTDYAEETSPSVCQNCCDT
jgi:hypothetical protein